MAILFQDEKNIIKCDKCGSKSFFEKNINSYIQINPRIYKKHRIATCLICSKCNTEVKRIKVENNENLITD